MRKISLILVVALMVSLMPNFAFASTERIDNFINTTSVFADTPTVKNKLDSENIKAYTVSGKDKDGQTLTLHIGLINTENVTFAVKQKENPAHDDYSDNNKLVKEDAVKEQIKSVAPNSNYLAINANYFGKIGYNTPEGLVIENGNTITDDGRFASFFGVTSDRQAIVDRVENAENLENAVSGYQLLTNGKVSGSDLVKQPRTNIGIDEDKNVVIMCCDGRNEGYTDENDKYNTYKDGLTMNDASTIMKDLGCTDAVNLDGGGSSQFVVPGKNQKPTNIVTVSNKITDRPVPTIIYAIDDAELPVTQNVEEKAEPEEKTVKEKAEKKVVKTPGKVKFKKCVRKNKKIKLRWKKAKYAKKYEVYQKKGKEYKKIRTVKKTRYTVKGLKPGTKYKFKVRGVNGDKYGKFTVKKIKTTNKKSVRRLAREVLGGKWGNGNDRKHRLERAGYSYRAVQNAVNRMAR